MASLGRLSLCIPSSNRKTSLVWNHCYQNGPYTYCKYCPKRFVLQGSTSTALHHVKNHHHDKLSDAEKLMLQTAGLPRRSTNRRLTDIFPDSNRRLTDYFPDIGHLSLLDRQRSRSRSPMPTSQHSRPTLSLSCGGSAYQSSDPSSSTDPSLPTLSGGSTSALYRKRQPDKYQKGKDVSQSESQSETDRPLSPAHSDASADTIILSDEERGIGSDHEEACQCHHCDKSIQNLWDE